MRYAQETVVGWRGRVAVDADGHELGTVACHYDDLRSGAVTWLGVALDGDAATIAPVPMAGAEPTGKVIRVASLGDTVRAAPTLPPAHDVAPGLERELAIHYRLVAPQPTPDPEPPPEIDAGAIPAIVAKLREAYSLEGEGILRLEALMSTVEDPEVAHDAALHADVTQLHRTGVEERLEALERSPSHLRDVGHGARAAGAAVRDRLEGDPVAAVRDAEEFERREAAFYEELERLAREAGDGPTADLAAKHRADELAMADTLAASIPRLDSPA